MNLKTKNILRLLSIIPILFFFTNCSKYEDGPNFTLKSKTNRITGEWEVVKVDGESPDYSSVIFEFEKDGDFRVELIYDYDSYSYTEEQDGEWEWADEKETIVLSLDDYDEDVAIELEILRLTKDELWFVIEDYGDEKWELEKK